MLTTAVGGRAEQDKDGCKIARQPDSTCASGMAGMSHSPFWIPAGQSGCYTEAIGMRAQKAHINSRVGVMFRVQESGVKAHKFQVGQTVYFTSGPVSRPGASGSYQILKLLPSDGSDYQYRIKSPAEAFERVAKESQLDRAG